jgi:hypothetical protein
MSSFLAVLALICEYMRQVITSVEFDALFLRNRLDLSQGDCMR